MFLDSIDIRDDSFVTAIVAHDYRTSSVFRKYGIDYCCAGKLSLQAACEIRRLDIGLVKKELIESVRKIEVSNSIDFKRWDIDFLADYIINVHHSYLNNSFPEIGDTLERLVASHKSMVPHFEDLLECFSTLRDDLLPHLDEEEKIIFPYIRQVAHAYENHEPYAALLVRTLRKPIENMIKHQHEQIAKHIHRLRELTNNYTPALKACITQKVSFAKLKELDNDLMQHIHLESNILFPKAVAMENEMLALK
jgi:regulator of cell morphogenesis and NO signaling